MVSPVQITVVGAGLMGHGIAQIFAVHGHPVWLQDAYPDTLNTAKARVRANLEKMAVGGIEFGDARQASFGLDELSDAEFDEMMGLIRSAIEQLPPR